MGLSSRKAIYQPFPQAIPSAYVVNMSDCLGNNPIACNKCIEKCEKHCIDFDMPDEIIELNVGTIIVATGMDVYDPTEQDEYGYTRLENVVTSLEFERLLCARLYKAGELDQVLFTIGLVFIFIAGVTVLVGPENQPIPIPPALQGQLDLGFLQYRTYSIFIIAVGIVIVIGLWLGFERTRFGAQIRAAVDNRRMAESLGINIERLFSITFGFGSGMAALGGGLGAEFLGLDPQYALKYLVFFLIVVAVGGLGRITGVFYASLIIGVLDFVLKRYLPQGGTLFIYALTILLLLWRPQGLFGKST